MEKEDKIWHMEFLGPILIGSLTTVSRELARYKLGLEGVQEFGWNKGHSKNRGYGKRKQKSTGNRTTPQNKISS
jgi:hypothetical protein